MNIQTLENLMYQLSDFFLAPVLLLLVILFLYSLYALGGFACQTWQRRQYSDNYAAVIHGNTDNSKTIKGYPLTALVLSSLSIKSNLKESVSIHHPSPLTKDRLDVAALKELEAVRTVSRLAPMLGLIATMVPMGPALKSLADGNVQGISDNLIVAFSAVIFGLVIASITFWIASIQKRWLATELVDLLPLIETANTNGDALDTLELEREAA